MARATTSPGDERLAALTRAGDAAAFETLFRLYAAPLCTFALHIVHSRETAADLVQDVFLGLWRNRERFEILESLQAYLYRATRNRALDALKHERIHRRWEDQALREHGADDEAAVPPHDRQIDARDLTSALEQSLSLLPERRRLVFLLRWKEEMSYAEIGELLEISPRTVEVQMRRALQTLRVQLARYLE